MPKKVRIGIVGGIHGANFQWHEHPDCIVQAVCDTNPNRLAHLAKTYQCKTAYSSLNEVLHDKSIDAVAVFTDATKHSLHSIACLNSGKHVISAVPAVQNIEQAEELLSVIKQTGLTYMMAETSYYLQPMISARKWHQEGKFGEIFHTEAEYCHSTYGEEQQHLWLTPSGEKTWRYGYPPMLYPTHTTAFLIGVTQERLTEVMCIGWNDGSSFFPNNPYNNPYGCETALFKTNRSHSMRVSIFWRGAHRSVERAEWYGKNMSFFMEHPNGIGAVVIRRSELEEDVSGQQLPNHEFYEQPEWWKTDMLPEPLRHPSEHGGSHAFLTHEFIDSIVKGRRPAIDIYEALAYTVPGIVAHNSALQGGVQMKIPCFDEPKNTESLS